MRSNVCGLLVERLGRMKLLQQLWQSESSCQACFNSVRIIVANTAVSRLQRRQRSANRTAPVTSSAFVRVAVRRSVVQRVVDQRPR